jgi:hypothetical protein
MTECFTDGMLNIPVSVFTEELLRKNSYSYGAQMLALRARMAGKEAPDTQ